MKRRIDQAATVTAQEYDHTQWIQAHLLRVDPTYQRGLDETRVAKMVEKFDRDLIGVVHVSYRDGNYYIIDGQHRVATLRKLGRTTEVVECKVYIGLTVADEAALFAGLNNFAKPRAIDTFRARVAAQDEVACAILSRLTEFGWRIGTGDVDGVFGAVVAAEGVYTGKGAKDKDRGPEAFRSVLGVVTEAWGHKPTAVHGAIIQGIGLVFLRYGDEIDKASLVKRLATFPGGPDRYVGQARGIREWRGGGIARAVAELTVELYNKRRTRGSIAEWHA